jgi:hypothetical protein
MFILNRRSRDVISLSDIDRALKDTAKLNQRRSRG